MNNHNTQIHSNLNTRNLEVKQLTSIFEVTEESQSKTLKHIDIPKVLNSTVDKNEWQNRENLNINNFFTGGNIGMLFKL